MASFLSLVAALKASNFRQILGLPPAKEQLAAPAAFALALQGLGVPLDPAWALPQITDALAEALGLNLSAHDLRQRLRNLSAARAPEAAPAAAASAPAAARAASATPSTSAGFAPVPKANKQGTLFQTKGIAKFWLPKPQVVTASRAQTEGAVPYVDFMEQVGIEAVTLPSERALPEAPAVKYGCDGCGQTFQTSMALSSHKMWKHPTKPRETALTLAQRLPFGGRISADLVLPAEGGGVRLALRINSKDGAQLQRETEEEAQAGEAAKAAWELEMRRRNAWRQQQRDSAEVELRRGSAQRHQYSHAEKERLLSVIDQTFANPHVSSKTEAFEADPRSRGCPYKTAAKWRSPSVRRQIMVGAARRITQSRYCALTRRRGRRANTRRWRSACLRSSVSDARVRARRRRGGWCTRRGTLCAPSTLPKPQSSRAALAGCSASSGARAL
jgi:hypothetical protein